MKQEHEILYDMNVFYNKLDLSLMKNFGLLVSASYRSWDLINIIMVYNDKKYEKSFILYRNYFYTINEILEYVYTIIIRNCKITDFMYYFVKEIDYILD